MRRDRDISMGGREESFGRGRLRREQRDDGVGRKQGFEGIVRMGDERKEDLGENVEE